LFVKSVVRGGAGVAVERRKVAVEAAAVRQHWSCHDSSLSYFGHWRDHVHHVIAHDPQIGTFLAHLKTTYGRGDAVVVVDGK